MRKVLILAAIAAIAGSASAVDHLWKGGVSDVWSVSGNWADGGYATISTVPTASDLAVVLNPGGTTPCRIASPGAAVNELDMGKWGNGSLLTVDANGTLTTTAAIIMGALEPGTANTLVNNGQVNVGSVLVQRAIDNFENNGTLVTVGDVILGDFADAESIFSNTGNMTVGGWLYLSLNASNAPTAFNMDGGTFFAPRLEMPQTGRGRLNLNGGTMTLDAIGLNGNGGYIIDVGNGVLVVAGDETAGMDFMIGAGLITAFDGYPGASVFANFDGTNTTLSAVGGPVTSTVWDDSFATNVVNANWTQYVNGAGAAVTQSGGQMVLDSGIEDGTAEASVSTLTDQAGSVVEVDGAPLYDFYSHDVSVRFDIASITGAPNGADHRNTFYFSIGDDGAGQYFTRAMDNGIGFVLEHLDTGSGAYWRMVVSSMSNGVETVELFADLNGLPSAITYSFEGTATTIEFEGATVTVRSAWDLTNGDTKLTGTMTDMSASVSGYTLAFGAYNTGSAVAQRTVVSLDAVLVKVQGDIRVYNYDIWAADWGVDLSDRQADYEGDGLDNLLEYALGGNPTLDDAAAVSPFFKVEAGVATHIYNRRTAAAISELSYDLLINTDLVAGSWTPIGETGVGDPGIPGFESVTNEIPVVGLNVGFVKLEVTEN